MSEASLDDPAGYAALDPEDMYARVNDLAQQIQAAWRLANALQLPAQYQRATNIVIAGMGGSAIGGSLVEAYASGTSPIPISVWRNYGLPASVSGNTLVIAVSYSGNTEETLSAFHAAYDRGAMLLAITTGGEIGQLAKEWSVPTLRFEYDAQPRATLGYLFTPLLIVMQKLGFLPDLEQSLQTAVQTAEQSRQSWAADVPTDRNLAKQVAQDLHGKTVVVYGADYVAPVARRWKTQLNENSKTWAFYEEFPELDHNAIVGFEYPRTAAGATEVVVLQGSLLPPRIVRRIDVTERLLDEYGVPHRRVDADGKDALSQMISLISLGDYVSYYLALLNGANPTEIRPINRLKDALARV